MMTTSRYAVPVALAALFIDTVGFGIVMPVLPTLITGLGKVDMTEATRIAGWMLVLFAVGQFFAGPVVGNLSDRFGRRPVLIVSMIAFGINYGLMAWAPTIAWLFAGRLVAGVAGAVYGPVSAVIADITPPDKRAAAFGLMGAAFGAGFIAGPALGGLLVGFGVRAPFIAAAVLALVNAAAMLALLPETLSPDKRRPFQWASAHIVGALKPLVALGATPMLVAWFLWQVAHQVFPATWAFWSALRFDWDATAIGLSLAYVGVIMALVQGVAVGRLVKRWGERRAALVGMACGTAGFACYAVVTQSWMVYPIFLIGALQGLVHPALNALMSGMVDARHQGALQGGLAAMGSISAIVGPLLLTQTLAAGAVRGFDGAAFALVTLLAIAAFLLVRLKTKATAPPASS